MVLGFTRTLSIVAGVVPHNAACLRSGSMLTLRVGNLGLIEE